MEKAKTSMLYDEILYFDEEDRRWEGHLVEPRRRPWHDAAVGAMLKAQAHFFCTRKAYSEMADRLHKSESYQKIVDDLPALLDATRLPFPVCWFEIHDPASHVRLGFAVEQLQDRQGLKLYTFQQHLAGATQLSQRFEGLLEFALCDQYPFAVAVQTTMSNFSPDNWYNVEMGDWLDKSNIQQGIDNLRQIVKLMLYVSQHYQSLGLVSEEGQPVFAREIAVESDMEKVAAHNRSKFYPFYELAGDWMANRPDRHPSGGNPKPKPDIH